MTHATSRPISRRCADAIGRARLRRLVPRRGCCMRPPAVRAGRTGASRAARRRPRRPMTDNGRCRQRTTPPRAIPGSIEINGDNVKNLRVAFTFSTGVDQGPGSGADRRRTTRCSW